jgi:hypothetical protein
MKHGFEVYSAEVIDQGIDFVARRDCGHLIEVKTKSLRLPDSPYALMEKSKFVLRDSLYLALTVFVDGKPPDLYPIPSLAWKNQNALLVSCDYLGSDEHPQEWGVSISGKGALLLEPYRFDLAVNNFLTHTAPGYVCGGPSEYAQ